MLGIHNLQESFDVGLLLGDGEVVNAEVVLFRLKLCLYFTIFFNVLLFSIIEASQHLQTIELAKAPKKAEMANH